MINGVYEGICVEFEQKTTTLDFQLEVIRLCYD